MTAVDGTPGQPYSDCYPVILDGAMVGWVEKNVAPSVVESLRRFKVGNDLVSFCSFLILDQVIYVEGFML